MRVKWKLNNIRVEVRKKKRIRKTNIWRCYRKTTYCIDSIQLDIERGRKVGQMEVIPRRRGEECGDRGRRGGRGGGGVFSGDYNAGNLWFSAGGTSRWVGIFAGDAVWVVMRMGGGGVGWLHIAHSLRKTGGGRNLRYRGVILRSPEH